MKEKLNPYILFICALFIVGGVLNNGTFSFIPAIPFLIIFLLFLRYSKKKIYGYIFIALCPFIYYLKSETSNSILYPHVGKEITLSGEWLIIGDGMISRPCTEKIKESLENSNIGNCINFGDSQIFTIESVSVRNPDFSEKYYANLNHNKKRDYETYYANIENSNANEYYIDEYNLKKYAPEFSENSSLYSKIAYILSLLMYYPVVLSIII